MVGVVRTNIYFLSGFFVFCASFAKADGPPKPSEIAVVPLVDQQGSELSVLSAMAMAKEAESKRIRVRKEHVIGELSDAYAFVPPQEGEDEKLGQQINWAVRELALGRRAQAQTAISSLKEKVAKKLTRLQYLKSTRSLPLDLCLLEARFFLEGHQNQKAHDALIDCRVRTFAAKPNLMLHSKAVLDLLTNVDQELMGSLRRNVSAPKKGESRCEAFVDGFDSTTFSRSALISGLHSFVRRCGDTWSAERQVSIESGAAFHALLNSPLSPTWHRSPRGDMLVHHADLSIQELSKTLEKKSTPSHVMFVTLAEQEDDADEGRRYLEAFSWEAASEKIVARVLYEEGKELAALDMLLSYRSYDFVHDRELGLVPESRNEQAQGHAWAYSLLAASLALGAAWVLRGIRKDQGYVWAATAFDATDGLYNKRYDTWRDPTIASLMWVAGGLGGAFAGLGAWMLATHSELALPKWLYLSGGIVGVGLLVWGVIDLATAPACGALGQVTGAQQVKGHGLERSCVMEKATLERGGLLLLSALPFATFGLAGILRKKAMPVRVGAQLSPYGARLWVSGRF